MKYLPHARTQATHLSRGHILLGTVVEDTLDPKGHIFGNRSLNVYFVFPADELAVDGRLHQFVEERATENSAPNVEELLVVVHDEVDGAKLQ